MTLMNWSGSGCPVEQNPQDISSVLESKDSRFVNPADFMEAYHTTSPQFTAFTPVLGQLENVG
jgi:hypothetical protein